MAEARRTAKERRRLSSFADRRRRKFYHSGSPERAELIFFWCWSVSLVSSTAAAAADPASISVRRQCVGGPTESVGPDPPSSFAESALTWTTLIERFSVLDFVQILVSKTYAWKETKLAAKTHAYYIITSLFFERFLWGKIQCLNLFLFAVYAEHVVCLF